MAKPSNLKRGRKPSKNLLGKGLSFLAVGAGLLVVATLLGHGRPVKAALATALSMPAWWAVGIGLVLVVIHILVRLVNRPSPPSPAHSTGLRKSPSAIRALIDQAEMELLPGEALNPTGTTAAPDVLESR